MYQELPEIESKRITYASDSSRLKRLQEEREAIFKALFKTPSDSALASRLNAIEVRIAVITGEHAIDY